MSSYSSTLLVTALKRSFTYLVSLDVPPIASIKFTVRRDNGLELGWLIEITYLGAEQNPLEATTKTENDVENEGMIV